MCIHRIILQFPHQAAFHGGFAGFGDVGDLLTAAQMSRLLLDTERMILEGLSH